MIGKSRGGSNSKIHAVVDARLRIHFLKISAGNDHDLRHAPDLVAELSPGDTVVADKAYDANSLRALIDESRLRACIPPMAHRKHNVPTYNRQHYRRRNKVERAFSFLKEFRAVATRYEKLATRYEGLVLLATIAIWLRN